MNPKRLGLVIIGQELSADGKVRGQELSSDEGIKDSLR